MKAKITAEFLKNLEPRERPFDVRDSQTRNFVVRVEPSGHMSYFVHYRRPGGGQTRAKIANVGELSLSAARNRARDILASIRLGDDPMEAKRKAKASTLGDYLTNVYGPWVKANRKQGEQTLKSLLSAFDTLLVKRLHELTPWAIEQWRTQRRKQRKKNKRVKNTTLNRNVACLRAALNCAVKWGILDANPLKGLERLPERDSDQRVRYLSDAEQDRLWQVLDARDAKIRARRASHNKWLADRGYPERQDLYECRYADYLRPMIELSMHTGLRKGEVFSLEWRDVDLDRAMLTVRAEIAKSGRTRYVPLNAVVIECLTAWREQTQSELLVFVNPKTGKRFDNIQTTWERVRAAAGLADFRWHDFRSHFASKLVMAGVDLNTVRELLGHQTIDMVLVYAHLAPEHKQQAVNRLVASNVIPFPAQEGNAADSSE